MTKDEFLNDLQEALSDSVPPDTVRENIQYYNDYIDEEESKGRSEAEVLDELGSPRLIAHTIKDTTPEAYSYSEGRGQASSSARGAYRDDQQSYHSFDIDLGKWYWKVILFVILFAVIIVVITVISGFMTLFLPVLPIIFVVAMMMMMFGGHR